MTLPVPVKRYLGGLLSAFSQLFNVIFLLGHPNESISGRSYREDWASMKWINRLFFWQVNHCKSAYTNDLKWSKNYLDAHEKSSLNVNN